jgi:hypothetical protein
MVPDQEVIDAEFVETEPKVSTKQESVVEVTISTARTIAESLHGAGFKGAADKAAVIADVAESARDTYQVVRPGIAALGRFAKKLQDVKIITFAERPPLRRVP